MRRRKNKQLTAEQFFEIKRRYRDGRRERRIYGDYGPDCGIALAREFGVSTSEISSIVQRKYRRRPAPKKMTAAATT